MGFALSDAPTLLVHGAIAVLERHGWGNPYGSSNAEPHLDSTECVWGLEEALM